MFNKVDGTHLVPQASSYKIVFLILKEKSFYFFQTGYATTTLVSLAEQIRERNLKPKNNNFRCFSRKKCPVANIIKGQRHIYRTIGF